MNDPIAPPTFERKLASLQVISELAVHSNADTLELATVLGWQVVVKKGLFKVGDLAVLFEVDSVLPEITQFEFLRDKSFRIRTVKLRGEVSQGLCVPPRELVNDPHFDRLVDLSQHIALSRINEEDGEIYAYRNDDGRLIELSVGDDMTQILGVVKYEPVAGSIPATAKCNFPAFLRKTDEPRIQQSPALLAATLGQLVVMHEKLDGTSFSAFRYGGEFGVCSRNLELRPEGEDTHYENLNAYWKMVWKYELASRSQIPDGFAIQGELVGPGIQGNKYKLKEVDLFVFNVYNITTGEYMDDDDVEKFCSGRGLNRVPLVYRGLLDAGTTVKQLVESSKGKSALGDCIREGFVLRLIDEARNKKGQRISFKVINPDFLLRFDD